MKIKPHRPRSCLGWFAWVFGILLLIFVLGNIYAQVRMAQVTWEMVSLARELGYTSGTHLHHEMKMRDTNIVSGSSYCVAKLYYITSMSVAEFTERLNWVLPETKGTRRVEENNTTLYTILELKVNGMETWGGQNFSARVPMSMYHWPLFDSDIEPIFFYDTVDLPAIMEYKGNRLKGNIVEMYTNGGLFPIWTPCLYVSSDVADGLYH